MTEKAMRGDRSAYDVDNYPEKHASDINAGNYLYHLPAPGTAGNIPIDDGDEWVPRKLVDADLPNPYTLKAPSILTLSSGEITVTKNNHFVAAESGTTDDLVTISGATDYQWLLLQADTGDTITVKHGTGNIYLTGEIDFELSGNRGLLLYSDGTNLIGLGFFTQETTVIHTAIFTVASTLEVASNPLKIYNVSGVTRTISKVFLSVGTAPTGADVIVDVNKNGTTLFTTQANRPTITDGNTTGYSTSLDTTSWEDGTYLTVDVDQIGSSAAGADLTVHIKFT